MADPLSPAPNDPPDEPTPPADPAAPPAADGGDGRPGRYDANVSLIRRRLADHARNDPKPRWWWRGK